MADNIDIADTGAVVVVEQDVPALAGTGIHSDIPTVEELSAYLTIVYLSTRPAGCS